MDQNETNCARGLYLYSRAITRGNILYINEEKD